VKLAEKEIDLLGDVRPHGLRRTYASLRTACRDDPVFVSQQIGHEDVRFTLNVYAQSVKRPEHMTEAERNEYDRAVEWASWATRRRHWAVLPNQRSWCQSPTRYPATKKAPLSRAFL
jgi:hypothetical protein